MLRDAVRSKIIAVGPEAVDYYQFINIVSIWPGVLMFLLPGLLNFDSSKYT